MTREAAEINWPDFWHLSANEAPLIMWEHATQHINQPIRRSKFCFNCLLEEEAKNIKFSDCGVIIEKGRFYNLVKLATASMVRNSDRK